MICVDGLFNAETGSAVAPFKTPKGIPPDLTEEFYEEFPNWEETAVFYGNDPTGTVEDWPDELEDAQKIDLFWDDYVSGFFFNRVKLNCERKKLQELDSRDNMKILFVIAKNHPDNLYHPILQFFDFCN